MLKNIFVVLMLVVLSGCATTGKFEKKIATWKGKTAEELTAQLGYPDGSFVAPNGNTVYVYQSSSSLNMPAQTVTTGSVAPWGSYTGNSTTYGGGKVDLYCKTFYEVENGIIVKYQYEGNNCTSF